MGLVGGTGRLTNFHEIRNFLVGGAQPTTFELTSSPNPSTVGQNVTFTATVSSGGIATFSTTALSVGAHSITASYPGDSTFGASVTAPVNQIVNASVATPVNVPTMTEWGMIVFMLLAGLVSIYTIGRARRVKSEV